MQLLLITLCIIIYSYAREIESSLSSSLRDNIETKLINWEPFEIQGLVNSSESIDFIKSLPLYDYWDASKNSFRTGILGEKILNLYPNLITYIEKKITINNKVYTAGSHVVDTSIIFLYSVSAIQYLIQISDEIENKIRIPTTTIDDNSEITAKYNTLVNGNESFSSIPELQFKKNYLIAQCDIIQKSIDLINKQKITELEKIRYKSNLNKQVKLSIHDTIIHDLYEHHNRTSILNRVKLQELSEIAYEMEQKKLAYEQELIRHKYKEDIMNLENEVNITMNIIAYRIEEELAMRKQQQEIEQTTIIDKKHELLKNEMEMILQTLFHECKTSMELLYEDPQIVISIVKYLFIGLVVLLVMLELFQFILSTVKQLTSKRFISKQVLSTEAASMMIVHEKDDGEENDGGSICSDSGQRIRFIFNADIQSKYFLIRDSIITATRFKLPLPNILISGPSGCGKTVISQIIMNYTASSCDSSSSSSNSHSGGSRSWSNSNSAVQFVVICGGDLKSLGVGASLFLTDVITKAIQQKQQTIVVLDEADDIILARSRVVVMVDNNKNNDSYNNHQQNMKLTKKSSGDICLFSLLNGLRQSSQYVSVIITSRLPLSSIDNALLDR
jgi:hypothetical protein